MVEIFFPWSSVETAEMVTRMGKEALNKMLASMEKRGFTFNDETLEFEKK